MHKYLTLLKFIVLLSLPACAYDAPTNEHTSTVGQAILNGTAGVGNDAVAGAIVAVPRCTGTIIAPHWIITAAHCNVPVGSLISAQYLGQEIRTVDRVYHSMHSDLAMLHVSKPFDGAPRISLHFGTPASLQGETLSCYGYGSTSPTLTRGNLRVNDSTASELRFSSNNIGQIIYSGDSGGPSFISNCNGSSCVATNVLAGVHYYGNNSSFAADTAVSFTRIWIEYLLHQPQGIPRPDLAAGESRLLHAPNAVFSQAHPGYHLAYRSWNGSEWCAAIMGNEFFHAPNCDWVHGHIDTAIKYQTWDGANWQATLLDGVFTHSPENAPIETHESRILHYRTWSRESIQNWTLRLPSPLQHAPNGDFSKMHQAWYVNYQNWSDSTQCASAYGDIFLVAPNCDWETARVASEIQYQTWSNGGNWAARTDGARFLHGQNGVFNSDAHWDTILNYTAHVGDATNPWTVRIRQN